MDDTPKNGSHGAPLPLTDEQKLYADRFRDWLLALSRQDFKIAVETVLQPLKASYHRHMSGGEDVSRPS